MEGGKAQRVEDGEIKGFFGLEQYVCNVILHSNLEYLTHKFSIPCFFFFFF